jgi:hypothetical protein
VLRLRAAATPAAFFVGLALICASLIEFHRWPYLVGHLAGSDFIDDLAGSWVPDLEFFGDRLSRPFRARDESWPQIGRLIDGGLAVSGATALLGLALVAMRRRFAGGTVLAAGISSGAILLALCALDLRLLDGLGHGCGPHPLPLHSPEILATAQGFVAWVSMLAGAAWLLSQRQSGVPIRLPTLAAVGLAMAMVATTVAYSRVAALDNYRHAVPPDRPVFALAFLLLSGVLLSAWRPLYSSRFVSALVLSTGCVAAWPALSIAHDERLAPHPGVFLVVEDLTTVKTASCEAPGWANELVLTSSETRLNGRPLDAPVEGALVERLKELAEQHRYINERNGLAVSLPGTLNLLADSSAPMPIVAGILRSMARTNLQFLDVISIRRSAAPLWTRSAVHNHSCAVRVELADDGQPISDFADWPSLVRAADRAEGKLRISVK